ncbi:MAG: UDP-glucose--hexose-1-phosphate uridylyltransferase [Oscillospiraceae bacterium]|nr:UDP-glucose--hexose-1-phosphate uridylyltransferase [Oscillospiraceae bacterium]
MIYDDIQRLISYALKNKLIAQEDIYVIRNQLMEVFQLTDWQESNAECGDETVDEILAPLIEYACQNGIISDTANSRDLFDTKLMGILTPMPREVIADFGRNYRISPKQAAERYFDFCKKVNYVRAERISKDMKWTYESEYGTLDITINRSKPEKDPRDIAAAKSQKTAAYPKCQLCPENAGFAGTLTHPARQNLRPVPITVNGEKWQFQYSPYGYFNEHCIFFNEKHVPMIIDSAVFDKLFDIVDFLPHYTVGSNADLPIVGGSILSHEHFQGGNYTFAMAKAPIETEFVLEKFPKVKAGIVKWAMSVIRVSSEDRKQLSECCAYILEKWRGYTDESAFIFAETDGVPHNTITPIVRKNGGIYECDLVLRNNITTEERPLGVFHPNPSLHHIKKENIGLIEVMGLAVLPSRLADELKAVEEALLAGNDLNANPLTASHAEWANDILRRYPDFSKENARRILEQEIGKVFLEVLEDASVFKRTDEGKRAFLTFAENL